jgi:hypothetical protein
MGNALGSQILPSPDLFPPYHTSAMQTVVACYQRQVAAFNSLPSYPPG